MVHRWSFRLFCVLCCCIGAYALFTRFHPSVEKKPDHLILISVDTLRTDYLGCYGNPDVYTPNLDQLFRSSIQFQSCISPMGRTNPAFASLHTGQYPSQNGVVSLFRELPEAQVTLAETLKEAGFKTAFFNANIMLRPKSGLTQGFDEYIEPGAEPSPQPNEVIKTVPNEGQASNSQGQALPDGPLKTKPKNPKWLTKVFKPRFDVESLVPNDRYGADSISDAAIDYINQIKIDDRVFMWIHYMDPHWPYQPPFPWNQIHQTIPHETVPDFAMTPMPQIKFHNAMKPDIREYYRNLYKGEIEYTDRQIGRLIHALRRQDILDSSLILFVSDHGESLGKENVYFCHGDVAYQDNISVPFMLRSARQIKSGIVRVALHLTDVMPVVLSFLNLDHDPQPPAIMDIIRNPKLQRPQQKDSLMFAWTGTTSDENPRSFVKGIEGRWRTVMNDRYKLIRIPHPDETRWELYDSVRDPAETRNLAGTGLKIENQLRSELLNWINQDNYVLTDDDTPDQPESTGLELEQLRNLGYID